MEELNSKLSSLIRDLEREESSRKLDNNLRRSFYSQAELLRLDLEEFLEKVDCRPREEDVQSFLQSIDAFTSKIKLLPVRIGKKWYDNIDSTYRFATTCVGIYSVGVYGSLMILLLRTVDNLLQLSPAASLSEKLRRQVAWFLLSLCGVSVEVVGGVKRECFENNCAFLTFSHASNLDGFLVSATCPVRHYALAKKELFIVPFFAWISFAIGGIPVDRNNRERAVAALQRTTETARSGDSRCCLVIAPEGTRSTSGHLQPFKKGVFHMWETLKTPIVPFVSYGAFDLFPGKSWMNSTGRVAVRYLNPILPHEAGSRDEMLRLLRRRMLEAFLETPHGVGSPLTWKERLTCLSVSLVCVAVNAAVGIWSYDLVFRRWHWTIARALGWYVGAVAAVTIGLYVYYVYLVDLGRKGPSTPNEKQE